MPEHLRQISLARSEGRLLLPPERDDEQRQLVEQQQAALLGYLDQRPRFAVIEDAGHENGQFVFLRGQASRG